MQVKEEKTIENDTPIIKEEFLKKNKIKKNQCSWIDACSNRGGRWCKEEKYIDSFHY